MAEKKAKPLAKENYLRRKVYNQDGQEIEELELSEEIFGLKLNKDLIHQAVVAQMANSREAIAHVKDRSEVRGGGKKPWRQKGTGRARHGSIRSPIWRGGGVTFGPTKERNFSKKINKKMRQKALLMVLSSKAKDNELVILDDLKLNSPKTKEMAGIMKNLEKAKKDIKRSSLVVLVKKNENIVKAIKNIPKMGAIGINNLNVVDVLKYKYLIMNKEGINELKVKNEKGKTTTKN
ncbi:MAG: 50S ribosomal protein L4 [Parcubacteria group bacterium GW2011_GWF2_39_13b]|nr:MAG: 50S ribosomal protein L4 [Parcubacteria group bacterium GW2011_GWF2_39_13b]